MYHFLVAYFVETQNFCPPTWPEHQTRDVRTLIKPNENTYKIVPEKICDNNDHNDYLLLIVVTSALKNFENRQAIRDSWGNLLKDRDSKVKIVFLVGEDDSTNSTSSQRVMMESNQYQDVLQATFIDSYYNLTIKSLTMLKWFSETCKKQNFDYLMKVDDDTYINIHQVINLLIDNTIKNFLTGYLHCGMLAQTEGKACLPPFMLKGYGKNYWLYKLIGFHWYPNYLAGPAYLMSKSTADVLYEMAMTVPAFHMEDVYITGMLSSMYNQKRHFQNADLSIVPSIFQEQLIYRNLDEIHPVGDERFNIDKIELDPCKYANLISSHDLNPTEMVQIHKLVIELKKTPNYAKSVCSGYVMKKRTKYCVWDMEIY